MQIEIPKLKKRADNSKLTIWIESEVLEIYRIGKLNGWDVSELVRRAISEALRASSSALNLKAE